VLRLYINPILLRGTSLARRSFSRRAFSTSCSRPATWDSLRAILAWWSDHPYACRTLAQAFESGAGLLVFHECATLGADGVQLGGYFLGEQRVIS